MPQVQQLVKEHFGSEPHKGVNPDEVVAIGAAVQAGVLTGEVKDVLLLDVTPLSLGIETLGGVMTALIPRNTHHSDAQERDVLDRGRQPDQRRGARAAGRAADGARQPHARPLPADGLPAAPRGVPQIEVTFDIDANGIVNVTAKDQATGEEQAITITASSGLDKAEVDRMVKDAEAHARDDQARRDAGDARNQADALVYAVEKTVKEQGATARRDRDCDGRGRGRRRADGAGRARISRALKTTTERLQRVAQGIAEKLRARQPRRCPRPRRRRRRGGRQEVGERWARLEAAARIERCQCRQGGVRSAHSMSTGPQRKDKEGDMRMAITRFDPFRDLAQMQDRINRIFGDALRAATTTC